MVAVTLILASTAKRKSGDYGKQANRDVRSAIRSHALTLMKLKSNPVAPALRATENGARRRRYSGRLCDPLAALDARRAGRVRLQRIAEACVCVPVPDRRGPSHPRNGHMIPSHSCGFSRGLSPVSGYSSGAGRWAVPKITSMIGKAEEKFLS